jgi:hypothetical protein
MDASIAHNPLSETLYFRRYARFQASILGDYGPFWAPKSVFGDCFPGNGL